MSWPGHGAAAAAAATAAAGLGGSSLQLIQYAAVGHTCPLYPSDAADEQRGLDLGGPRARKKKNSIDN